MKGLKNLVHLNKKMNRERVLLRQCYSNLQNQLIIHQIFFITYHLITQFHLPTSFLKTKNWEPLELHKDLSPTIQVIHFFNTNTDTSNRSSAYCRDVFFHGERSEWQAHLYSSCDTREEKLWRGRQKRRNCFRDAFSGGPILGKTMEIADLEIDSLKINCVLCKEITY